MTTEDRRELNQLRKQVQKAVIACHNKIEKLERDLKETQILEDKDLKKRLTQQINDDIEIQKKTFEDLRAEYEEVDKKLNGQ